MVCEVRFRRYLASIANRCCQMSPTGTFRRWTILTFEFFQVDGDFIRRLAADEIRNEEPRHATHREQNKVPPDTALSVLRRPPHYFGAR